MSNFVERAHRVGREVASRHVDSVDRDARFPRESFDALRDERLLGMLMPRELGGESATIGDAVAVAHALGQYCSATGMIFAMHQIQAACLMRHGLSSEGLRSVASRVARDQLLLASATTETGVGGNVRESICAVQAKDHRFTIEKQASVISYGSHADGILATARRSPDAAASDQALAVLLAEDYTLEQTSGWDTLGMRGTCSNGYVLRAEAPLDRLLPLPYADISARTMLPITHLTWAGTWVGIVTDAVARARAYVRAEARKRGSAPPAAIRLAALVAGLEAMQGHLEAALARFERASDSPDKLTAMSFAVAMNALKTSTSTRAVELINEAMLICGINGYRNTGPYSLSRHLRDAYSAAIMVNNDRIMGNTSNYLLVLKDIPELNA
ncbi:acyl-CoA dehydrogenase [Arboricoccus pini]|uniref:Acyl-CoA dehydrogenase n=1 Tax=Arboricoccus pini TaxID=1963835 RepID=A0A212RIS2_9PROT|nr:acyl-CoA dehydrogenase family protein [Arboricoccus pini]SNB72259.1 acyl-CoA dehydrogenase [Arboricoccus pini]